VCYFPCLVEKLSRFVYLFSKTVFYLISCRQIYQNYINLKTAFNINETGKKLLEDFLTKQDYWLRSMVVSHPAAEDPYWRHVSYVIAQFDGLYAGYKSAAEADWVRKIHLMYMLFW